MNTENVYYVYEHWRPDTGACFYVGKGKGKRAWDLKRMRNKHFCAVVAKLARAGMAVDVRVIARDLAEEDALQLEIKTIALRRTPALTNLTEGGDGMTRPTAATRAKISASQKQRFKRPEELAKLSARAKGRPTSAATKAKLSRALCGRKLTEEHKLRLRAAAKKRGISEATRAAQKTAVTGRKRAPFSAATIVKMQVAALAREAARRSARES